MSVNDIIFASLGTALFIGLIILILIWLFIYTAVKYSLQGTTQSRYLTGGVTPVRFSM